jgi:hypothetical protein
MTTCDCSWGIWENIHFFLSLSPFLSPSYLPCLPPTFPLSLFPLPSLFLFLSLPTRRLRLFFYLGTLKNWRSNNLLRPKHEPQTSFLGAPRTTFAILRNVCVLCVSPHVWCLFVGMCDCVFACVFCLCACVYVCIKLPVFVCLALNCAMLCLYPNVCHLCHPIVFLRRYINIR